MQVVVKDMAGNNVGEAVLRDDIFGIEPNVSVMHQALVRQMANRRLGTHKTKTRSEVSRSKAKWYRQKGTGRARHGSRNAPIFVGGGIAHGPQPRSYTQRMPRKMHQLALRSALSAKAAAQRIVVLDGLRVESPKTRVMEDALRNPDVLALRAHYLNVRDLLKYDFVIMPTDALTVVEQMLG
jgi:large subunit ribosomal protein L4